jgi:hypothetical protein
MRNRDKLPSLVMPSGTNDGTAASLSILGKQRDISSIGEGPQLLREGALPMQRRALLKTYA